MTTCRKVNSPFPGRPSLGDLERELVITRYRRCCGIDVHKNSVTVCVLAPVGQPHIGTKRRNFRTFTRDLKQLRGWLKHCQVTEAVMESTGQYWRAVWNILEGEVPILLLVNPVQVKAGIEATRSFVS